MRSSHAESQAASLKRSLLEQSLKQKANESDDFAVFFDGPLSAEEQELIRQLKQRESCQPEATEPDLAREEDPDRHLEELLEIHQAEATGEPSMSDEEPEGGESEEEELIEDSPRQQHQHLRQEYDDFFGRAEEPASPIEDDSDSGSD